MAASTGRVARGGLQYGLDSRIPEIMVELPVLVQEAITAGSEVIAADAATNAPVYSGDIPATPGHEPGTLRDSIGVRPFKGDAAQIVAVWWWFFVELGTVSQPPQPFMLPAAERGIPALEEAVRVALRTL